MKRLMLLIVAVASLAGTRVLAQYPEFIRYAQPGELILAGDPACNPTSHWTQNELTIYWFDVGESDAQFVIGPNGTTLLIDVGRDRASGADRSGAVATKIKQICGLTTDLRINFVMGSHHHRDHIGSVEDDSGIYRLLRPGGHDFTPENLLVRLAGSCTDRRSGPDEVTWLNAGQVSDASAEYLCWARGDGGTFSDRNNIKDKIVLINWPGPLLDLGPGVTARIVGANGYKLGGQPVKQINGDNIPGNHTTVPPCPDGAGATVACPANENDYSIALKISYGAYSYVTGGDISGRDHASGGVRTSRVEQAYAPDVGNVDTLRTNHHGLDSSTYWADPLAGVDPETAIISCGYDGNPPARGVLERLAAVGRVDPAQIFLTNSPCEKDPVTLYDGLARGVLPNPKCGVSFCADVASSHLRLSTTLGGARYQITTLSNGITRCYTSGTGATC